MHTTQEDQEHYIRIGDKVRIRPRGKRGIYIAEFGHEGQHQKRSLKTANLRVAKQRSVNLEAKLASGEYASPVKPLTIGSMVNEHMGSSRGRAASKKPSEVLGLARPVIANLNKINP